MHSDFDGPQYLPVALRVDDAPCIVVGSGMAAANKTRLLVSRARDIRIFTTHPVSELRTRIDEGQIYRAGDERDETSIRATLKEARLIFIATEDAAYNRQLALWAGVCRVPCCVVDDIPPSSFITPAIIDRSPIQVAIISGGAAPVLARRLRTQIEASLPHGVARLAQFMKRQRAWVRDALPDITQRRHAWERFLDSGGRGAAERDDRKAARMALENSVAKETAGTGKMGEVWLVGAGPGDPDLLTLAALNAMQNADCVLYDQLIPDAILDRLRRDAERIFVGKKRSHHTLPQTEITQILAEKARQGLRVLRLKGGDPFIFGRGGEEMDALMRQDIPVRIIPGITAASGCGASAGIPLTHRDYAQSCIFVTGHAKSGQELALDWAALAKRGQTLAIYMGLTPLATLARKLVEHGLPPDWPAAIIEKGTWETQRVFMTTLEALPEIVTQNGITSPTMTIIGEVVKLRPIQR
ncbi:Siroheme synthase [Acetobacteraceae bacterium EV16G]|uniref:Siroheme synthase n=1 Tax=Sorlinia euscelidii TaxID=3081148 RepID=A0ABU7U1T9_9PROT